MCLGGRTALRPATLVVCGSFNPTPGGFLGYGNMFGSPGQNDPNDTFDPTVCKEIAPDNTCIEDCIATIAQDPSSYPSYNIGPGGYQCHDWTKDVEGYCKSQCP
jgi:hypothetical protein